MTMAGVLQKKTAPLLHPTAFDIVWAAGVYEGEGSVAQVRGASISLEVTQKDTWILEKLRGLFGGSIHKHDALDKRTNKVNKCYRWKLGGARGHGFALTIYKFLSPRRQEQLTKAFNKMAEFYPRYWKQLGIQKEKENGLQINQ